MIENDFKHTEVGVIPSDWNVDEIQYVVEITTGAKNTQDRNPDGAYPFFVRSQTIERINSYSYDGEAVLTAGDGVGTGKVFHYINGKFDFHQRVYKMSGFSKEKLDGYYFYLYFSKNFYNRIMQMTAKSSVDSVRREMIAKMLIPLPTLSEQTAIATALNDADALITALEKLIAKKKAIKQGAMQELLKPKEGWNERSIGDCADVIGGGTPSSFNSKYWNGRINWFTPTEVGATKYLAESNRKITEEGYSNCSAKFLPVGTILLTSRAGIGDLGILTIEACTNQGFQSLIPKDNSDGEFLYYLLGTLKNQFIQNASGSTFLEISPGKLKAIEVTIPEKAEQILIAQILSDMDLELDELEKKLEKQKHIKQGMMQELLTGKTRLI